MSRIQAVNIIFLATILLGFTSSVPLSGYFVPHSAISVFSCDIKKIVAQLLNNKIGAGSYTVSWNGQGIMGQSYKAGLYFVCLSINHQIQVVKKMIKYQ